ncbi:uncharacterized protein LOC142325482 [Lycorma delicatula]|uniref:uncharacterized protein LOC142325482 n=1 Tax=Lycorma delicatula TaxID=130591 RepID=UPI003F50D4F3
MMSMMINKDVKNTNNTGSNTNSTSGSRVKAMPPLTLYRPPAARNDMQQKYCPEPYSALVTHQSNCNRASVAAPPTAHRSQSQLQAGSHTKKIRRPDQQMYIPRPRRSETNMQNSPVNNNFETTPNKSQNFQQSCIDSQSLHNERAAATTTTVTIKNECSSEEADPLRHSENNTNGFSNISNLVHLTENTSRNNSSDSISSLSSGNLQKDDGCPNNLLLTELNTSDSIDVSLSENNNSNCSYNSSDSSSDSSSMVPDTSMVFGDEVPCNDLNGVQQIFGKEKEKHKEVSLNLVLNSENEEKEILYSKRKETHETENNETVNNRAKQIHLIDDSIISEKLPVHVDSVNCDKSLKISNYSKTDVTENNIDVVIKHENDKETLDKCDWESLFDDEGNCLEPNLLNELSKSVGRVKVTAAPSDYRSFQTVEERSSDGECIVEIYGFPAEFKTRDLLNIFAAYRSRAGFQLKWVDDTHALGVFNSPVVADEVLQCELPFVKTRPLRLALPESRNKARTIPITLPPAARPKTCPALAKRLVTGALGLRIPTDRKKREEEKLILKEARDQRRLAAKQREAAWEGTIGTGFSPI